MVSREADKEREIRFVCVLESTGWRELNACEFLCPLVVKADEVGARTAVIAWRSSTVVYHSYRLIYQVAGEETKVIIFSHY